MTINISGQVPAEEQNGMYALEEQWTQDRVPEDVYAVVRIARHGVKLTDADQSRTATMKFVHIEPLDGKEAEVVRQLLLDACRDRGGEVDTSQQLDFSGGDDEDLKVDIDRDLKVGAPS